MTEEHGEQGGIPVGSKGHEEEVIPIGRCSSLANYDTPSLGWIKA
jgi:hypothetical protein